jgi:hypothetical protein
METLILITVLCAISHTITAFQWYKVGYNKRERIFWQKPITFCNDYGKPVMYITKPYLTKTLDVTVFDTRYVTLDIKK